MAAPRFAFEELTAPINWPRVASTNVRQLQKLGDASALRAFLADVCVGDADDGFLAYGGDDRGLGRKALRMNQYATQYLLYSQQILAAQKATLEKGRDRLRRKERAEKRRYLARKEKLRILEEEVAKQDRLIATHQAVLQSVNPDVARRVAQEADGRVVVLPPEDAPRPARRPATPESYHDGFTDPESSAGSDGELVARPTPSAASPARRRRPRDEPASPSFREAVQRRPMMMLNLSRGSLDRVSSLERLPGGASVDRSLHAPLVPGDGGRVAS